jgi:hypothetical protein
MVGRRQGEENGLTEKINRIIYNAPDGRAAPLKTGQAMFIS